MSSATSDVTYTSVYSDSEPGRAFWGAEYEEVSEGDIPRVIVLGYDGLPLQPVAPPSPDYILGPQILPVPQDEDEREPMFIQAHDPDYVPEPIYPEYIPLEDDHEFPAEEQPLPPVDSPTAESPGYVTESDPEEDPEEYEDDKTEDGPVDYPMDGGDDGDDGYDGDDDDDDSSGDDARDEDDERAGVERLLARTTPSPSPPIHFLTLCKVGRLLDMRSERVHCRLLRGQGIDYGFVSTVDAEERRQGIRDVGYGIRDTWVDLSRGSSRDSTYDRGRGDRMMVEEEAMLPRGLGSCDWIESGKLIGTQHQVHETRFHMQQTEIAALRETDRRRQDQMVETLRVIRDMRREMSDMQAELLALREQRRIARQSGPEARIPDHQEASGDADSHI
ncbi:hypothetical protein Tco_0857528 [Tanacetum coccineum]|uniref:Uncharacterized protein n=1 Tax=Tanacetum coccineum TaxID=301880 RepID=A0ABQ5BAG4_9ASTR